MEEAILSNEANSVLLSQGSTALDRQISLAPIWKQEVEGFFLEKFLADDHISQKPSPGYYVFEIMCEMSRDILLESSIQSLCLSRVGRMNKDDRLLRQGFVLYTFAVRKLHVAMSQASTRLQDSTLAAAKIMNLYEVREFCCKCAQ